MYSLCEHWGSVMWTRVLRRMQDAAQKVFTVKLMLWRYKNQGDARTVLPFTPLVFCLKCFCHSKGTQVPIYVCVCFIFISVGHRLYQSCFPITNLSCFLPARLGWFFTKQVYVITSSLEVYCFDLWQQFCGWKQAVWDWSCCRSHYSARGARCFWLNTPSVWNKVRLDLKAHLSAQCIIQEKLENIG